MPSVGNIRVPPSRSGTLTSIISPSGIDGIASMVSPPTLTLLPVPTAVSAAIAGAIATVTASNLGSGTGLFLGIDTETLYDLQFRSVTVGQGLALNSDATMLTISLASSISASALTLIGDASGSGSGTVAMTLANTGVSAGTYSLATLAVDSKGRVISASSGSGGSVSLGALSVSGSTALASVTASTPSVSDNSGHVATTAFVRSLGYLTANQSITVSGDVSGSGSTALSLVLASTGVTPGTYNQIVVDAKGRVLSGTELAGGAVVAGLGYTPLNAAGGTVSGALTVVGLTTLGSATGTTLVASDASTNLATTAFVHNQGYLTANQAITLSGDASATGSTALTLTLAASGVSAGTYNGQMVVDAKGRVLHAANLLAGDVTGALGYTPLNPAANATLSGSLVVQGGTALNAVTAPTPSVSDSSTNVATTAFVKSLGYLLANQSIAVSGDVSGSGSTALTLTLATTGVTAGTYNQIVVDAKGRVLHAANLLAGDVTGALGYTPLNPAAGATLSSLVVTGSTTLNSATGVTLAASDNSTNLATTAFVKAAVFSTSNEVITLSGDASGTGSTALALTLAATGVTAGTYNGQIVVDAKGRVLSAAPLRPSDITGGLGYTPLSLAGGTLSGTLTVVGPTALGAATAATVVATDNSSNIATTAFVKSQGFLSSVGSSSIVTALGYTPLSLNGGTLSGGLTVQGVTNLSTATAPTVTVSDNSANLATTAWVHGYASANLAVLGTDGTVPWALLKPEAQNLPLPYVLPGKPAAGQVYHLVIVQATTVPANFVGTRGYCGSLPTAAASFSFNLIRAGTTTPIGSVAFTTIGATALALGSSTATSLVPGDVLQLVAPASQDATLADIGLTVLTSKV